MNEGYLGCHTDVCYRMLENPSDESVVRWGNDGDSFVVLEVGMRRLRDADETFANTCAE
jgi:hypothetical protein